jgi:predicted metal-dependent peptidase
MAVFDDAYTAVLLSHPFFGQLLTKFKIVAEDNAAHVPTLAVSVDTMFYHPPYVANLSDEECIAAITHEVLHGMFQHLVEMDMYRESGVGPDGKPYDAEKYNRAADYVINDLIKVNKIGTLGANWCWDPAYPHTMTPQEIYEMLPQSPPKGQQSHDKHIADGAAGHGQPAINGADIMAAWESSKAMGCEPVGMDRLIKDAQRPKHSPWAMLRQAYLQAARGSDTNTWRKLNRHMLSRGVIMPGRTGFATGRVGVVVDTSGSIGEEMLNLFGSHMGAIMSDAKPKDIQVYWTDADVQRIDHLKSGNDLKRMLAQPVPGGGGTDMEAGIKRALQDKCEIIVVLTDGYTAFNMKKPSVPVIWAMTTAVLAPYGKNIKIC